MSQPTLTSLPKELREKILAEALSVDNNTIFDACNDLQDHSGGNPRMYARLSPVPHERKVGWDITAPLFLVNRQISNEALGCFHRENTLVAIETNGYPFLKNCASQIIPMCPTSNRKKDVALHLKLVFRVEGPMPFGRANDREFAVMAARDLPTLVRLINATSIPRVRWTVRPENIDLFYHQVKQISLNFHTRSKFYAKGGIDATNKLVNLLKGIRQFQ